MNPPDLVLLDTSGWVHYLRLRGDASLKNAVQEALNRGQIATCHVIITELLVGARDQQAFEALSEALSGVPNIPITPERWDQAGHLGFRMRKQGLRVPLPDLVIAQCAISTNRVLWHVDGDFERIRLHSDLRTRHWGSSELTANG